MRWMRAALLVGVAATACQFSFTGVDAGAGSDDMSTSVDLAGSDSQSCACATGCGSTGACLALVPSGPVTAADYGMPGINVVNVTSNITIDADSGMIMGPAGLNRPAMTGVVNGIGFHVVPQASGPSVGIFSVGGLTLAVGVKITIKGTNAFALASAGAVTLDGTVDASCSGMMPGPGGFGGGMGGMDGSGFIAGAGKAGLDNGVGGAASGGGGAGYGDAGGAGGLITAQTTSNGGVPWGDLTTASFTLVGGPGGGGGGQPMGGKGGAGGGAVQFAVNGALTITGIIDVGGCGGVHAGPKTGGGGGGAGGAIVLEAAHVTLSSTAVLAANGGGGGGGAVWGGGGGGGVGRIAVRAQNPTMGGINDSSIAVTPDAGDLNSAGAHPTVYGAANFQ